jgi:hypothetical protein
VERIGEQLQALTSSVVTNVDLQVLDDKLKLQAERFNESMKTLGTKVDASEFESKWRALQLSLSDFQKSSSVALASLETSHSTISTSIAKSADATEVALLRGQVREAAEAVNRKAEAGVVEQLSTQYRQLMASLQQKAEHVELETLRGRVTEVKAIILEKAEHNEVNRLSVLLEGLTQGLSATLEQKIKNLVPPAMEQHVRTIIADQNTTSLQLSECKSYNAALKDKMSQIALDLSRQLEKDREDALAAAAKFEADFKQLETDCKHQAEIATNERLEIQKACNASIMQLTADVSGKAEIESVAAVASAKADKHLLEETVLALTLDMTAKITSEVSAATNSKWENLDFTNRVRELSRQVELKADVQMLNDLKKDTRNQFDMIARLDQSRATGLLTASQIADLSKAKAPLEETQTASQIADLSKAKAPLGETQTLDPSRATPFLEQTQTLAPKRQLIPASLPACSNNVANWLRCLVELLVSATDPRSETAAMRVGGGFLYGSDVSFFDRRTRQGLLDILDSCTPAAFSLNLSAEETLANGRTLQILREESQPQARIELIEKKFDEIDKKIALKADAAEVSKLALMIQSFGDGTYGQALRTQQVVTRPTSVIRPTSARFGGHGRHR